MPDAANPLVGESEVTDKLHALLEDHQRETGPQLRSMHPKTVACLAAEFRVLAEIPTPLSHGLFAKPQSYCAWIRLSNALAWDDREPDFHGFALKILGVTGAQLPESDGELDAQDILFIDTPIFFTPDVRTMYEFLARRFGLEKAGASAEEIGRIFTVEFPRTIELFSKLARPAPPPLESQYGSCVPSRLGPHVVKYFVQPRLDHLPAQRFADSPHFARDTLVERLTTQAKSAHFDFYVQLQENAETMPVDDATVEWHSQLQKVAELTIPPQIFDTAERDAFGESLVFNPWRTLPDHVPLGALNEARLSAYRSSAAIRAATRTTARTDPH